MIDLKAILREQLAQSLQADLDQHLEARPGKSVYGITPEWDDERDAVDHDLEIIETLGQNTHIDGVTLTNAARERVHVRTCREYDEATAAGYFAYSTFDMKMAVFFEHQSGLLRALRTAKSPLVSYIADPRVGVVDLRLLPYSLFPDFADPASPEDADASYHDMVASGRLVVKDLRQNLLRIQQPNGMGQQLVEAARADLNGDGVEDILCFSYGYATHGTLGFGGVLVLTRRSADGRFERVDL